MSAAGAGPRIEVAGVQAVRRGRTSWSTTEVSEPEVGALLARGPEAAGAPDGLVVEIGCTAADGARVWDRMELAQAHGADELADRLWPWAGSRAAAAAAIALFVGDMPRARESTARVELLALVDDDGPRWARRQWFASATDRLLIYYRTLDGTATDSRALPDAARDQIDLPALKPALLAGVPVGAPHLLLGVARFAAARVHRSAGTAMERVDTAEAELHADLTDTAKVLDPESLVTRSRLLLDVTKLLAGGERWAAGEQRYLVELTREWCELAAGIDAQRAEAIQRHLLEEYWGARTRFREAIHQIRVVNGALTTATLNVQLAVTRQQQTLYERQQEIQEKERTSREAADKAQQDSRDAFQQTLTLVGSVILAPALVAAVFNGNVWLPHEETPRGLATMLLLMVAAGLASWASLSWVSPAPPQQSSRRVNKILLAVAILIAGIAVLLMTDLWYSEPPGS